MDLNKLGKNQISLSEWLEKIGFPQTEEFRKEDNEKNETLPKLNQILGLPFDQCSQFEAEEISNFSENFSKFFAEHKNELCAYRLIPLDKNLPKLRMRGHTVEETLKWFKEQIIDLKKYRVDIYHHANNYLWSTIFVVNKKGIFGEIIKGNPFMLTQGFYAENQPITFSFDFTNWQLSEENLEALEHLKNIIKYLKIENLDKQIETKQKLNGNFFNNYLAGYFETTETAEFGLWFIDWNKILGEIYQDYTTSPVIKESNTLLQGQIGHAGKVKGRIKIINNPNETIKPDEIIVCQMTTPEYLPLMKTCAGIITELGGILSHAAIVARELKKPCVVGVKNVLEKLKDDDLIEIENNEIRKI